MDLEIIREFTVLAETCNYQTASNSLSMSQSALSKHIQKLEDELDLQLFDRSKRNVSLNENGEIFLRYARELCKVYDKCENELHIKRIKDANSISVGFIRIHDQYDLIEHLTGFSSTHPDIHMSMVEHNGDQVKSKLTSGECDFVFTAEISGLDPEEYDHIVYRSDVLVALLPSGHPLADRDEITLADIAGERFIEHSMPLERQLFNSLCKQSDIRPEVIANINYAVTIMRMVSQGMGVSVLSKGCVDQYRSYDLLMKPIIPETGFNIYLVFRKQRMNKAAKAFLQYFRDMDAKE